MRKPSIFSRDYEKLMKKRRRRIITVILSVTIICGASYIYISSGGVDFTNIRERLQAWVDSDKIAGDDAVLANATVVEVEPIKVTEKHITVDIVLPDASIVKVSILRDEAGKITFNEVKEGQSAVISPDKTKVLITDSKQNMILYNSNGEQIDISKKDYKSKSGSIFLKDSVLQKNSEFIWHKDAAFISDNKIAFVSNLPYIGSTSKQYIWVYNLDTNEYKTIWKSAGREIYIGKISEKGLEINIDGKINYVTTDETVVQ